MTPLRRHLSSITSFALVAMLALALLPTLSRSAAWLRGDAATAFAQICTPQGMKRLDAAARTPAPQLPLRADASLDACDYCLQLVAGGVPSAAAVAQPTFVLQLAQPPASSAPALRSGWRSPQPRAPPPQA